MKLTSTQLQNLRDWTKAQGIDLRIEQTPRGALGRVNAYHAIKRIKSLMIVNTTHAYHSYTDANGTDTDTHTHDPRKTLAHEYTHILQIKAGYYTERSGTAKQIYNYNEIVANTIGMLLYPSETNIIDNAGYTQRYLKAGTGNLMQYLEADIDELLPEVEAFLNRIGIPTES